MASIASPLVIDGSHGEGGSALLRVTLAMAALTQQPVRVVNIRFDMPRSGLSAEDLTIVRAIALACRAEVMGAEVGSNSLSFIPLSQLTGLKERIEICDDDNGPGTGNACVVAQALATPLARSGMLSTLGVSGETYGHNILSFDYFRNVTVEAWKRIGLFSELRQSVAGFGRDSRGSIDMEIEPSYFNGINWEKRGRMTSCKALLVYSDLPGSIAERGAEHLAKLAQGADLQLDVETRSVPSKSPGCSVTLWAEFENGIGGHSGVGARGIRIETVVQQAFASFAAWMKSGATTDAFLADQILLACCLSDQDCVFTTHRLTKRFLTIAWV
ncbi:MAG: RNA 3'-terminal phosphate cyclase, partial [Fimbriimonadaceae bacterium]